MRIGIVNDLAIARQLLSRVIQSLPGYSIAWMAEDGEIAIRKARQDRPDAILMDLIMPNVDGVEATRQIMKSVPCSILIVTSTVQGNFELVYRAMGFGALDAVETPSFGASGQIVHAERLVDRLHKLEAALRSSQPQTPAHTLQPISPNPALPQLVAIAASTGGPDALVAVLASFPSDLPAAVVIVQHIAAEYTPGLRDRLATQSRISVKLASIGESLKLGVAYLAATNDHLILTPGAHCQYTPHPSSNPYRPSADVLFASLASSPFPPGIAVILTGMGSDGAVGLAQLRALGWHTIAQNEASCVVYGMPRAAVERQAAIEVLPLHAIGPAIVRRLSTPQDLLPSKK